MKLSDQISNSPSKAIIDQCRCYDNCDDDSDDDCDDNCDDGCDGISADDDYYYHQTRER